MGLPDSLTWMFKFTPQLIEFKQGTKKQCQLWYKNCCLHGKGDARAGDGTRYHKVGVIK